MPQRLAPLLKSVVLSLMHGLEESTGLVELVNA